MLCMAFIPFLRPADNFFFKFGEIIYFNIVKYIYQHIYMHLSNSQ